jgi:hypothetical protein
MFDRYWRKRAERAEAALAVACGTIKQTDAAFDSLQKLVDSRAVLVSMTPSGRKVRLLFQRNGDLTTIDAYATIDADWNELERKLLK